MTIRCCHYVELVFILIILSLRELELVLSALLLRIMMVDALFVDRDFIDI